MTYEELFKQTQEILTSRGFYIDEDIATKVIQQQTGEVIINGQRQVQTQSVKIKFCILGEGELNNEPMVGYKLVINGRDLGDEWMTYPEDLVRILDSLNIR